LESWWLRLSPDAGAPLSAVGAATASTLTELSRRLIRISGGLATLGILRAASELVEIARIINDETRPGAEASSSGPKPNAISVGNGQ
jgi:hypothetical protein